MFLLMVAFSFSLKVSQQVAKAFYDSKVQPTTLIPKQVGNMYTASLYAAFASLIHNKHNELVICFFIGKVQFASAWWFTWDSDYIWTFRLESG